MRLILFDWIILKVNHVARMERSEIRETTLL